MQPNIRIKLHFRPYNDKSQCAKFVRRDIETHVHIFDTILPWLGQPDSDWLIKQHVII